jgi:hypothetical protein
MNDKKAARISDDDILSFWHTVRPSGKQYAAMTYVDGPYDLTVPTCELRQLVELAIERGRNDHGLGEAVAALSGVMPFLEEDYYSDCVTPEFRAAMTEARRVLGSHGAREQFERGRGEDNA